MTRKSLGIRLTLLLGDAPLLVFSVLAAYWIRFDAGIFHEMPRQSPELYYRFAASTSLICIFILYVAREYSATMRRGAIEDVISVSRAVTSSFVIAFLFTYLSRGYTAPDVVRVGVESRLILILSWAFSIALLTVWRLAIGAVLRRRYRKRENRRQVLIIGADSTGMRFFEALRAKSDVAYWPIGFLEDKELPLEGVEPELVLGEIRDLEQVIQSRWIDEVVVTARHQEPERVSGLLSTCERADIQLSMLPSFLGILRTHSQIHEVAGLPIVMVDERIFRQWNRILKRTMDLVLASFLTAAFCPILIPLAVLVSAAIKLGSPGPILFRQQRVGKGGRPFELYKFRSMAQNAEAQKRDLMHLNEAEGALFKMKEDPRVTRVGKIIRRCSIDELPQIINVLKGEMSLVGPRPPILSEVKVYEDWQMKRFDTLPGMVGLPQVSGRSDLTFDEVIRLDVYYIENWSLLMDVSILLRTIPVVVLGKGAY